MKNIKVIELLSSFSKEEFEEFEEFLEVSFLSSPRNLKPLFNIIKKYYGNFENDEFTQEYIYKKLFGNKKFSEKYLTAMFSHLYKSVKNFLAVKEVLINKPLYNNIVTVEFLKRQFNMEFEKHLKNAEKTLDESPVSANYFNYKKDLAIANTNYLIDRKDYDAYKNSYLKAMEYISLEFLTNMLKNYAEYYVYEQKNILNHELSAFGILFDSIDFEKVIENIRDITDREKIFLKILYLSAILDREKSLELYYEVKKMILDNYQHLDWMQKRYLHGRIINFLSILFIEGNFKLNLEMFELNNIYLNDKDKPYLQNGIFSKRDFRNNVVCALFEKKYDWAINFINKYNKYLLKDESNNIVNYNLALVYNSMKDLDKSLEVLSRVKLNFGTYKEEISVLKTTILYEKGFYQEALENIQTFKRTFKKTSVMTRAMYDMFKDSITFLIKFLNIVVKHRYTELDFLEQQLNESKMLSVKPWLLGKISELKTIKV